MEAKMQLLDYYINKYKFEMKKKVLQNTDLKIDGKLGYRILNKEEKENFINIGLEIQNSIVIAEDKEIGKIDLTMVGIFSFDKKINKDKMEKLLKVNGVAILYQQMRAYINATTSLSSSIPAIILPVLNFTNNE